MLGFAAAEKQASDWFQRSFVWAIPLLKAAFAWDVVGVVRGLLMQDIPHEFNTPKKMWRTFRCPLALATQNMRYWLRLLCQYRMLNCE